MRPWVLIVMAAIPAAAAAQDAPLPTLTLEDAVARAQEVDPGATAARGQSAAAVWSGRAAQFAFFVPHVSLGFDASGFSEPAMNIGTLKPGSRVTSAELRANYELFGGGRRVAELRRARAVGTSAAAAERAAEFSVALDVSREFFGVLAGRELLRVAHDRARRAEEQLGVARSRVRSGAAVQSDSLQAMLELTRARQEVLEREAALRSSRLALGRRTGVAQGADADTSAADPPRVLPVTLEEALDAARRQGPRFLAARAGEQAAAAALAVARSAYLPRVQLYAAVAGFDNQLFPDQTVRSQVGVHVSLPVWDGGSREIAVARARAARETARATREDLDRAVVQEVTQAYDRFHTARASVELASLAITVAQESFRVSQVRYRSGATTILDVLEAQTALTRAEADRVQARQQARLAIAELEAILGARLTSQEESR